MTCFLDVQHNPVNNVVLLSEQLDEEAMASMLADFVDCPPDEEENVPSPVQS